jgi:hypothetical protein
MTRVFQRASGEMRIILARLGAKAHDSAMANHSPFDDPVTAAAAWARFRRIMRWMFLVTVTTVIGALSVLYKQEGAVSVHFYIAVAIGMSFAMLLMAGLMGLVFISSRSGHDESLSEPPEEG